MTTATDTLQNTIARGMAAHLFAFLPKPESVVWADGNESVESLECTPGHVHFAVCTHDGDSRTCIGTADTSVAGIRELGRLAALIVEDRRAIKQFRNETIEGTAAGCEITVEYFEESGQQRACAYIERSGYSASLECAENEGVLHGGRYGDGERTISERTVAACRRWVEKQGQY